MSGTHERLMSILEGLGSVVIAFSGGTDSSYLLKSAHVALARKGGKVLAVTATSSTYPESELNVARNIASEIGVEHRIIRSEELDIPGFADNAPDRCFYCKGELFGILAGIAEREGYSVVCDGSNADDMKDYRPGRKAAGKFGVRSPLIEAGISKEDVRQNAKMLGLSNWDKPAAACLASRFPYGTKITSEKLGQVEKAEEIFKSHGFAKVRVRHHGGIARVEVERERIKELVAHPHFAEMASKVKALGFDYVAIDMEGYRTGSMNEVL